MLLRPECKGVEWTKRPKKSLFVIKSPLLQKQKKIKVIKPIVGAYGVENYSRKVTTQILIYWKKFQLTNFTPKFKFL